MNAFDSNNNCRSNQRETHDEGCNRLSFAVTVRMILIWRSNGDLQTNEDHQTGYNISSRLQSVSDQCKGMPKNPRRAFRGCEKEIDADATTADFMPSLPIRASRGFVLYS